LSRDAEHALLSDHHESGVELLYVAPKDHVAPNI